MAGKTFKNIAGTYDVLPMGATQSGAHESGTSAWQYVERVIADIFRRHDFLEIRTPILEPTALVARGLGALTDIVSKEMFAFEREGTPYVMRPELTAPIMRSYMQHHLGQQGGTQKLYYMGPCFRAERPQKGRYRQFSQFGCEVIGSEDIRSDAEAIVAMIRIYEAFGIKDYVLRINSLGDQESRPRYKKALQSYFEPFRNDLSPVSQKRLDENPLRLLDTKNEKEKALLSEAPLLTDFLDDESRRMHEELKGLLSGVGVSFVEDPMLVRGLDYYTRTAFELESPALGAQSALAGGGRYDMLAVDLGSKKPIPAVGFAAGFERLLIALAAAGTELPTEASPDVYIVSLGDRAGAWGFQFADTLRAEGFSVAFGLQGRSLKAQMREANRKQVRFVVIVGEDELTAARAVVKDMHESTQESVDFDRLPSYFKGLLPQAQ